MTPLFYILASTPYRLPPFLGALVTFYIASTDSLRSLVPRNIESPINFKVSTAEINKKELVNTNDKK